MDNPLATLPVHARRVAGTVGGGLRSAVPDRAIKWVETGAALAALNAGVVQIKIAAPGTDNQQPTTGGTTLVAA